MPALPLLDKLFADHPIAYQRVAAEDRYGFARRYGELMLARCEGCPRVVGVKKLATDGGASTYKFLCILAEMRFALTFAAVGARAEILGDEAFGSSNYAPDLHVRYPDGFELLVEVMRIADGSAPLSEALDASLQAAELPFRLEQCAGKRLSIPAFDRRTHAAANQLSARVAEAVVSVLKTVDPGSSGIVRVFDRDANVTTAVTLGDESRAALYDDVTRQLDDNWLGTFGFAPSTDGRPACGGGVTSGHIVDEEVLGAKFVERVQTKAAKRSRLPSRFSNTPYVLAFQNNESELGPVTVLSRLTGSRAWSPPPKPAPLVPQFAQAATRGWQPLLEQWHYTGVSAARLLDHGVFGGEAWSRDVSGVMVLHHSDTLLQWLPNPFAHEEIAPTHLMSIGLPLDILGASSPQA